MKLALFQCSGTLPEAPKKPRYFVGVGSLSASGLNFGRNQ